MNCVYCGEVVSNGEQHPNFDHSIHRECAFRTIVGGVAHVLRRCSCFNPESKLPSDPPNLTKREAAIAARDLWAQIVAWYGEEGSSTAV